MSIEVGIAHHVWVLCMIALFSLSQGRNNQKLNAQRKNEKEYSNDWLTWKTYLEMLPTNC